MKSLTWFLVLFFTFSFPHAGIQKVMGKAPQKVVPCSPKGEQQLREIVTIQDDLERDSAVLMLKLIDLDDPKINKLIGPHVIKHTETYPELERRMKEYVRGNEE